MAEYDIDKITFGSNSYILNSVYNSKWPYQKVIGSKTYTNVIATANNVNGGGFFYMKVRASTFNSTWRIKVRVLATVPGQDLYRTDSIFEIWGFQNTYSGYSCNNHITSGSYRPIYYHSHFRVSQTGYNNNCGAWIGFSLYNSTNPTSTSYKRTVVVELLEYENCTVELQNSLITPGNIPDRAAHTDYYSSSNTSYDNFDAYSYGLRQSGDSNTTNITNLYRGNGNFVADSALYQYQLLFHVDADKLTPLNNNNNVTGTTKTMLVNRTFDPFGDIYYYNSTTTVAANAAIGAGACYYALSGIDLRYTFNISTSTFTAHKDVYLKVSPQSDGTVKLASATPWTQAMPTSNDGFWYIYLGRAYNGYCIAWYNEHPVFMHDGTSVKRIFPQNGTATASTSGLMTSAEKTKLAGISAGATANVGTITGITMNGASKGTSGVVDLGTVITSHQDISGKADKSATVSNVAYDSTNKKITKTINGTTSDVVTASTLKTSMSLGNVENKSSATIRGEITSSNVTTALGFTPMNSALKGANSGVAELDSTGKVPLSQLPSYVDDVLEYDKQSSFPATGEAGKIYVAKDTNKTYRWSGSAYVEISPSLALGETSSTAYRGDRGKTAYDHASAKGSAFTSGLYKITTNSEGHVTAATAVAKADITGLGIPGSDTNTHRPIQVNGTEILGDNTTALNLKAGSNVSVTNSSGTVTIAATDTKYTAATAAPGNIATSGAQGSSTNYARQDHTHGISLATGDSNGQVKIAGSNVSVKGLGSAAYTNSTAYAAASHTHSGNAISGGYLNVHPENSPVLIPFINNDIAYLLKRGGSSVVKYDSTTQTVDLTNVFDASPSYWAINPTGVTTITIELTLHKSFSWTNTIYVDFGAAGWRSTVVKIEVMNSNYSGDAWTQKYNNTNNGSGHCYVTTTHTPAGASNAGGGFNKIRFTFSGWATSTIFRIAQLGIYNYASGGLRETFVPKDGGPVFGSIYPNSNNGANLGTTSQYFSNAYITNINGVAVGSSPKFTDTNTWRPVSDSVSSTSSSDAASSKAVKTAYDLAANVSGKVNNHTVNSDIPAFTSSDSGKFLTINSSGAIVATTMTAWQGGNY